MKGKEPEKLIPGSKPIFSFSQVNHFPLHVFILGNYVI